jgi:hypothetical protein
MGSRRRRSLIGMAAGTVVVCAILAGTGAAAHQPGSAQFRTAAEQPSLDLFAQSTALAKSGGRFSFSRRIRKTTRFYAEIDSYRGCQEASVAPAGCISETMVSASSPNVRVRVPKPR